LLCFLYWHFAGSENIKDEELSGFLRGSYFFVIFSFVFGVSGLFSEKITETFPYFLGTFFWTIIWKINLNEVNRRIEIKNKENQEKANSGTGNNDISSEEKGNKEEK